jgi:carboxypeptidase C (cathepsin A)
MEEKKADSEAVAGKGSDYKPPKGSKRKLETVIWAGSLSYEAEADWIILRKDDKPQAEMFYIRYFLCTGNADVGEAGAGGAGAGGAAGIAERPLTFVFNGGPGASSVYLHLGALGPRRVDFKERGDPLPPPHALVDNEETWLQFTDLVFIDPIGTGFSRMIRDEDKDGKKDENKGGKKKEEGDKPDIEYWKLKRDLESLGEFIRSFLSRFHRWESPVYIAGESYGGFRVAKLARLLQESYGVGLSGAIMISPALEFTLLDGSDYDALMWLDSFPTMAGAAAFHGRARKLKEGEDGRDYMRRAAEFALNDLLAVLAGGDLVGVEKRGRVLDAAADWIGLPRAILRAKYGRVEIDWFVKNLLRDKGVHLGLYDASMTVKDPYPDRDDWVGPDPTLHTVERVFAAGINSQLRKAIGLETDRDYALLSDEVNTNWKVDTRSHALDSQVGATDDLRYGMSLNPDMKVWISHGVYDLVTPWFATDRISRLMKLDEERRSRLTVKHYLGGHMFYTWKESRMAFFEDMRGMYGKE